MHADQDCFWYNTVYRCMTMLIYVQRSKHTVHMAQQAELVAEIRAMTDAG